MERLQHAGEVVGIVVSHDSAAVLPSCLSALTANGVPALVVDNASRDGSRDVARRLGAQVIRNALNQGYGRANNLGAGASDAAFILVLNPDVVLEEGAVAALLEAVGRYPDAGLLAPRIVEPDGRVFLQPRSLLSPYLPNPAGRPLVPEGDCCVPFLSGACLLIRRDLFIALGGFDDSIFLFYEDDDLCRRVADAGHALVHVDRALARHVRGGSSSPRPGRAFRSRWHLAWSRAYVSAKYDLPRPAPRIFVVNAAKAILALFTFRRPVIERYAGSAAGALAFMLGRTALRREGLSGQPPPR